MFFGSFLFELLTLERLLEIGVERRMQKFMRPRAQSAQDQLRFPGVVERDDHWIQGAGLDPGHDVLHGLPELHDFENHYFGTQPFYPAQKLRQIAQLMLFDNYTDG